jgi:hypothetical protein
MSEEAPLGLKVMEKLFGILLIAFGIIISFYYFKTEGLVGPGFIFFLIFGVVLIILGVFMLLVKVE